MSRYDNWNAQVAQAREEQLVKRKSSAKRRVLALTRPTHQPVRRPFRRASELYMHIMEIRAKYQHNLPVLVMHLEGVPEYVSHGHGGKHRTKNHIHGGRREQDRSKYTPHQAEQERLRRISAAPVALIRVA